MARIRSIKPEFPQSETIGRLSREARLLFIQLWTIADDCGRARASSRVLASLLYPFDDDAKDLIDSWLAELSDNDCLFFYEDDGNRYLQITNWLKHQKIDRPSASRIPEPKTEIRETLASPREPSMQDIGPRTKDIGSRNKNNHAQIVASENFESFYKNYPKRINRKAAEARFLTAIKNGVDPNHIISAAKKYAEAHFIAKTEQKYIPAPDVWLNKGSYDDEDFPQPARAGPTRPEKMSAITKALLNLENNYGNETQANGSPAVVYEVPRLVGVG